MESRQRNILIFIGIVFIIVVIFVFLFKYGMQLFFEDFDYFKAF